MNHRTNPYSHVTRLGVECIDVAGAILAEILSTTTVGDSQ